MSFLSKALTVVGAVVGIAAAIASGGTLGFLAAGLIGLGAASSLGLVGGSIGKFMNSGIGRGLVLAAGAYAALGAFNATSGTSGLQANATEAGAQQAAQAGSSATAVADNAAASLPSVAGDAAGAGTNQLATGLADSSTASASGADLTTMNMNATAEQQAAQATNQVSEAAGAGTGTVDMPGMGGEGPSGTLPSSSSAAQSAVQSQAAQPSDLTGVTPPGADMYKDMPPPGSAGAGAGPSTGGGIFSKLGDFANTKGGSALLTAGGNMLGGIGQGIAQKQAMEDQIRAQQWSNNRWVTPSLAAAPLAASQGNIVVPGGYLQRAAQTRSLMSQTQTPFSGPVPPTALPGAVPPVPSPVKVG